MYSSTSTNLNSCSVESTLGSCSKYCFKRKKYLPNIHPSDESSDLLNYLTKYYDETKCNAEDFYGIKLNKNIDKRYCSSNCSICSHKSTSTNCSSNHSRFNSSTNEDIKADKFVYQMDYSRLCHFNHVNNSPMKRPINFVNNNVNKIDRVTVNKLFYFLLFFLLSSFVQCADQSHNVQLVFETEENQPVNHLIGQIRVPDSFNNYTTQPPYIIVPINNGQHKGNCNPNFDLNIDQHTGDIRNAVQLDREKCSMYIFLAISLKGISFKITIRVLDQNDNRPYWPMSSINIQLPESGNLKPNEIRRQLPSASDLDSKFGLKNYRIKSGNTNNAFKLFIHRENDGILYVDLQVNNELDREEISSYKLIIEALDGGEPPLTAELEVNIEILDINDQRPAFDKSVYQIKLQQNATIGTRLIQTQATDKDIDLNGQISYSLQESANTLKLLNKNGLSNRLFEIDSKGWITLVNSPLTLPKSLTTYELIVIARDGGEIPLETNALVLISIQTTNNYNLPKINVQLLNENNRPELNESVRIGEIVARILINDEDGESEQVNKVNYKLTLEDASNKSNESTNNFKVREINQNTYLLIVSSKLDREQQDNFNLKLIAFPQNNPSTNSSQLLQLNILDSNDNRPYFKEKSVEIELNQYSEIGTLVYKFTALDKDLPSTNHFIYSIDESKSDKESLDWFELDRSTGELRVKQLMNCNINKNPILLVSVNDGLNQAEENTNLIIKLQSNNNHVPIFEQTIYNLTLDESAQIGHCFFSLVAYDLDCGSNSTIEYHLMATNRVDLPLTSSLSAFQLNKTTGELCLSSKLNFEKHHFYELIVMASNPLPKNRTTNDLMLNSTSIVHIYLEDANTYRPKFLTTQYKVNVHENIVPLMSNGMPASILVIKAHDEDASPNFNTIIYSIINGNEDLGFEIDQQTGQLFLLKPLSSVRTEQVLIISAEDLGGLKSENTATVHIYVLNSAYQQYFHFSNSVYNFNLVENALAATKIGKLNIQATSSPFNYVNMLNSNQNSSSQSSSLNSVEHRSIQYSIYSGNDEHYFELDSTSGELILTKNSTLLLNSFLDYEKVQNLLLNVQCRLASSVNSNEFTFAYSQINISLINLNDNSPEYVNDLSIVSLRENSIRSTTSKPVFAVKPIDVDANLFGRIRTHFRTLVQDQYESTDQVGPFYMNKFSGEIYLNGELDYEQQSSYDLNVQSVDGGGRTSEMQIKVNLIDLSDNPPYFIDSNQHLIEHLNLSVSENEYFDEQLYHFTSLDLDVNDKTFFYSILSEKRLLVNGSWIESDQNDCFKIGLISGDLKVNCVLDAERVSNYELKLQVRDCGDNKGYLLLNIKLLNVNDNEPTFSKSEYRFQFSENSLIGSRIGQLVAVDLDIDSNGSIQFDLVKNIDNAFRLDSMTGELFLNKQLDRECDKDRWILKAQVSDREKVKLTNEKLASMATIIIDITDVNDHKPVWLDQHQSISNFIKQQCTKKNLISPSANKIEQFKIPSHSQISTIVTKIIAFDMDLEENGTIHYTIKHVQIQSNNQFIDSTNGKELFQINADGLITTRQVFEHKNQVFRIAIEAEDSRGLKADQLKWIEIIVKPTYSTIKQQNKINLIKRSDVEYIEIESLSIGQSIGSVIDLKHHKLFSTASNQQTISQQILNNCKDFYLDSGYLNDLVANEEDALNFTLNINETKINLVSLVDYYIESTRLNVYFNSDCSLRLLASPSINQTYYSRNLPSKSDHVRSNEFQKLLTFEIEPKMRKTKERPFDCIRKQLRNSEFGEELMQINLDLNQEISYEKSIDLYDFKRCSTIQFNQRFKIRTAQNQSTKLLNQIKLNGDLVLQLWPEDDQLPYDQEILINIQAIASEYDMTNEKDAKESNDDILVNFVFNKRNDLNLNNLKVISNRVINKRNELVFLEDCCLKNEIIHQFLLNSDLSENYNVKFKFLNNNRSEYELFKLDNNGLLSLANEFDYETKSIYELDIRVEINELSPSIRMIKQLDHSIRVVVIDVNDEWPKFNRQELDIECLENVPIGTILIKLKATDRDQMDTNLTYAIADGYQHRKTFELNSKTGELRLKNSLDKEKISNYKIPVIVFDNDNQHNDQAIINLNIININDNGPSFKQREITIFIPENIPINTSVYRFIASDDDVNESNQLIYDLIDCENCPFKLDSRTGQLTTKDIIDYETLASYNLTVSVTDGQHSSTCNLFVKVKNLFDNPPMFDRHLYEIMIDLDKAETNDQLYYELLPLKASDLDGNSKLYYSINLESNDDGKYFTMNSTTGQLTINQAVLNHLIRKKLESNINEKSISTELVALVIDQTDYNVLNATTRIRIQFNSFDYLNAIREELKGLKRERIKFSQYPIVLELDENFLNKKLSFYLVNSDRMKDVKFELINQTAEFKEQFSLSSTGEFSLKQSLKNRNYECFVLAKSEKYGETLNLIQFTRIPLIHSPIQLRKFSFELSLEENLEAGQRLIQLEERVNIYLKKDHLFRIIYSSLFNSSWFDLDSRTGLLKTAIKFDYEKHPSKIELIVLANIPDSYHNLMLFNLSINLINVNDNPIIFNHPIIYSAINESLPKDTFVCRLGSIDLDNNLDNGLTTTYHIVEGNRDNAFKIIDNSIYTNVVLDREIREHYTLFIFANDALHQSTHLKIKSNSPRYQTVEISVMDINDNCPFASSNLELSITTDNTAAGLLVGTLNSNDVDIYPPILTYELIKDSNYEFNNQLFDINQFTGEIRLKREINPTNDSLNTNDFIDYDSSLKEFHFNVIASDSLHQAETRVKVNLKPNSIYQQTPIFTKEIYYFEMENKDCSTMNCALFQIKTLPLKRPNANSPKIKIQYKLLSKVNRYFYIDLNDGKIYNNQTLSSSNETNKNRLVKLVVQSYYAFENGRPINNLKSTSTLFILIKKSTNTTNDRSKDMDYSSDGKLLIHNQTIELEKYQYGEVIYRLPVDSMIRYELLESNSFALKNKNQIIILKKPKRIETQLRIKVIRSGLHHIEPSTDIIELNVRLMTRNRKDDNQIFRRRLFNINLYENTTIGHQVVDLRVNEKANYSFFIHKGNQLNHFKLDQSTGILFLSGMLNCKLTDHYNLIVIADNGLQTDFAILRIKIQEPSNHLTLPIWPLNQYQAVINENIPIGTKIIKMMNKNSLNHLEGYKFVLIRDDLQSNSFTNQFKKQPFEFDYKTGYLISASSIDYERLFEQNDDGVLNYKLGIQFINSNFYSRPFHNGSSNLMILSDYPNLKSITNLLNKVSIRIKVNSEDEFYPKFEKDLYDFKIEIQPNETNILEIGTVHAEDLDVGKDGEIIYSINSTVPSWTKELFIINSNTGVLTFDIQTNNNPMIGSWLQSTNCYASLVVIAKSSKPYSLSSMTIVDIDIKLNRKSKLIINELQNSRTYHKSMMSNPNTMNSNANINKIKVNSINKNVLTSINNHEPSELNQIKLHQTLPKQQPTQNNIARTVNESFNGQQRKLIPNNLIQVYGIVIGLLVFLLVLILFSVILLFRICNFNRKDTNSSNSSIYNNSKTQSDYDPNCQLSKSISCLIGNQNPSDSTIILGQHNKLKQTDFMINMALQRNSIIYQEHHTANNGYSQNNANLIKPTTTDTSSNCNTSITILHSHENSETKSISDHLNSDSSLNQDNDLRTSRDLQNKQFNHSSNHQMVSNNNSIKTRPLPDNPPDLVFQNSYQDVEDYQTTYYSNYKELENSFNHNYEAISPAYEQQIQFWTPSYHPVAEILKDVNSIQIKPNLKPFIEQNSKSQIRTAKLANTNKLS